MEITFTKVKLPYGFLSNMSPYPISYDGKVWRTAEALFQSLRFVAEDDKEAIRKQTSPMAAKLVAKHRKASMVVVPGDAQDQNNMRMVLKLKLDQHPHLKTMLLATGNGTIIEDCTNRRASIWGAKLVDGKWEGDNLLGKLWMELRDTN